MQDSDLERKEIQFVWKVTKRKGSYQACAPAIWNKEKKVEWYFGKEHYIDPKSAAETFIVRFLSEYYGAVRAMAIMTIPHFIKKLHFGCGVSIKETYRTARGKRYPVVRIFWCEQRPGGRGKKKSLAWAYSPDTRIDTLHRASLKAAKIRAELTFSTLDAGVLSLDYDLDFIKK